MTLAGFRAKNHPQQTGKRGADDATDDRAITMADFEPLHARFRFTIDVAASATNARLPRYWTRESDALEQSWAGERVWCNPPYSHLERWVGKAWDEFGGLGGAPLIVMLLPANRTEQRWWQELIEPKRDRCLQYRTGPFRAGPLGAAAWQHSSPSLTVEFLPGRMRFERPGAVIGPKGDRPPFGCCLAIWSDGSERDLSEEGQVTP